MYIHLYQECAYSNGRGEQIGEYKNGSYLSAYLLIAISIISYAPLFEGGLGHVTIMFHSIVVTFYNGNVKTFRGAFWITSQEKEKQ